MKNIDTITPRFLVHQIVLMLFCLFLPLELFSQFQSRDLNDTPGVGGIVDKCGYDPEMAEQMTALLGLNWGYGYDSLLVDLDRWSQSPYVTIDSIGASVQNRAIWQLTITSDNPITNTPRHTIFVHARTHPIEVQAWWVTNAMINFLLSEDPFAQFIRENCTFYIIPMYNPDGVELGYPRHNAHDVDLESNWDTFPSEPEVQTLRNRFTELMASPAPIEVALNMHAAYACRRYFVYHDSAGTSPPYTLLEQNFINGVRYYFPDGIEPWYYFISWTNGTPPYYPESWFWLNFGESVMALTYEDMNCPPAGAYDTTAYALLHGVTDYLGIVTTITLNQSPTQRERVVMDQNYPNPVHLNRQDAHTIIQYRLATPQTVRLTLYDILGRRIATLDEGFRGAGTQRVYYDASHLASGVYLYRLETPSGIRTKRFLVVQ
ncbi:MAG: T9SS C-terminal target domain-containing protein [Calditrichaeota bacterium]|nr:MAG: T9SS C-terminal target domain-containing protein [Calditrichota bacterium]